MRSASDRRAIALVGLLGALAFVGASCARVHIEPGTGTGGDGGDAGQPGTGGRGGAGGTGGSVGGAGGSVGGTIAGNGGGGSGGGGSGGTAGSAGAGGRGGGGSGGTAGSAGAGGRGGTGGGTGGTAGSAGSSGSGGTAGSAGSGGTAGSAGAGGAAGRGGSGGTAGSAGTGGSAGSGGSGGTVVPMGTTPSVAGQIVITELMHNTTTINDDTGEWIEVYNPSTTVTYDLLGCEVSDTSPPGDIIDANFVLPPMAFKTMAVSATPGFVPDYVYTPAGVAPIVKFDNQGGDGAQIRCGGVLIDEFTYPSALAPSAGHSFSVDPAHYNAIDNDTMANSHWCAARDTMPGDAYEPSGPNYGTPGRPNTQCP